MKSEFMLRAYAQGLGTRKGAVELFFEPTLWRFPPGPWYTFPMDETIAAYIIRRRGAKTPVELARILEVSLPTVKAWEAEETVPKAVHLVRMAEAFGDDVGSITELAARSYTAIEQKRKDRRFAV